MLKLKDLGRRRMLRCGAAAGIFALTGCGGGSKEVAQAVGATPSNVAPAPDSGGTSPLPAAPNPETTSAPPTALGWNVTIPMLNVGSGTFDLSTTLPANVARDGIFGVDPAGASLPAGMTLSPAGVLSVGTATVSIATGVVFTYDTV